MTPQEAYNSVIKNNPGFYGNEVYETDEIFIVPIRPINVGINEPYFTGTTFPAIKKQNGSLMLFDVLSDPDSYHDAKVHEIQSVFDEKIK